MRDRAMAGWHNAGFIKRTTAVGAEQPGDLRAYGHAFVDCDDPNTRDGDLRWSSNEYQLSFSV